MQRDGWRTEAPQTARTSIAKLWLENTAYSTMSPIALMVFVAIVWSELVHPHVFREFGQRLFIGQRPWMV